VLAYLTGHRPGYVQCGLDGGKVDMPVEPPAEEILPRALGSLSVFEQGARAVRKWSNVNS
jgi:hypothetical protein